MYFSWKWYACIFLELSFSEGLVLLIIKFANARINIYETDCNVYDRVKYINIFQCALKVLLTSLVFSAMYLFVVITKCLLIESIYKGLRRPRWSQFASEIYKVDTIVYSTYNVGIWSFFVLYKLWQVQFRYRLKLPKQPKQDSCDTSKSKILVPSWKWSIMHRHYHHNSVTVNSVGVNTTNKKNPGKTRHGFADACRILQNTFLLRGMSYWLNIYIYIYIICGCR